MIEYKENDIFGFELEYGYEVLPNGITKFFKPTNENKHILKYAARGPSFSLMSEALTESTYINHITGNPFILTSVFYKIIFEKAIIEVIFDKSDLLSFKTNNVELSNLNYNLVKFIAKDWAKGVL